MTRTFTTWGTRVEPVSLYGDPMEGVYTHTILDRTKNSTTVRSGGGFHEPIERTFQFHGIEDMPICWRCCHQAIEGNLLQVQMILDYSHLTWCGKFREKSIDGSAWKVIADFPSLVKANSVCAFYESDQKQ